MTMMMIDLLMIVDDDDDDMMVMTDDDDWLIACRETLPLLPEKPLKILTGNTMNSRQSIASSL